MIWVDRVKYADGVGPGDMLIFCASCQAQIMLTMPLAAQVVMEHIVQFQAEHQHGRQFGTEPLQLVVTTPKESP